MPSSDDPSPFDRTIPARPPAAPGPGRAPVEDDTRAYAQDLARAFEAQDVHPVVIIGTGGSGKTAMLQSLLAYAINDEAAGFYPDLGASVFPDGFPGKASRDANARVFYENALAGFRNGQLSERTQLADGPFFVPITMNVVDRPQPLRFAFLETMGEWFEREKRGGVVDASAPYVAPRWELATLLATREHAISVIFVAPTVGIEGQGRDYSFDCVANAMSQYQRLRIAKPRDNVMLLVSKWDAVRNPDDPRAGFMDATAGQAVDHVRSWKVWPRFCAIDGLRPGARAFMPYSAARVNELGVMTIGDQHAGAFNQFNRTVWNWLYGNATERPFSVRERPVLYPDVVPRREARMPLHQRLTRLLLHRRGPGPDEAPPWS